MRRSSSRFNKFKEGKIMKKNMGSMDKTIRAVAAAAFLALVVLKVVTGTLALILGAVTAVFVLTSLFGVCPLYLPFGISTCSARKK
jgi:hypothetical protein